MSKKMMMCFVVGCVAWEVQAQSSISPTISTVGTEFREGDTMVLILEYDPSKDLLYTQPIAGKLADVYVSVSDSSDENFFMYLNSRGNWSFKSHIWPLVRSWKVAPARLEIPFLLPRLKTGRYLWWIIFMEAGRPFTYRVTKQLAVDLMDFQFVGPPEVDDVPPPPPVIQEEEEEPVDLKEELPVFVETVDPEGGSIVFEHAELIVPEGAFDSAQEITLSLREELPDQLPVGFVGFGGVIEIDGLQDFHKGIEVLFFYTDAQLEAGGIEDEHLVSVLSYEDEWRMLPVVFRETERNEVTVLLSAPQDSSERARRSKGVLPFVSLVLGVYKTVKELADSREEGTWSEGVSVDKGHLAPFPYELGRATVFGLGESERALYFPELSFDGFFVPEFSSAEEWKPVFDAFVEDYQVHVRVFALDDSSSLLRVDITCQSPAEFRLDRGAIVVSLPKELVSEELLGALRFFRAGQEGPLTVIDGEWFYQGVEWLLSTWIQLNIGFDLASLAEEVGLAIGVGSFQWEVFDGTLFNSREHLFVAAMWSHLKLLKPADKISFCLILARSKEVVESLIEAEGFSVFSYVDVRLEDSYFENVLFVADRIGIKEEVEEHTIGVVGIWYVVLYLGSDEAVIEITLDRDMDYTYEVSWPDGETSSGDDPLAPKGHMISVSHLFDRTQQGELRVTLHDDLFGLDQTAIFFFPE